MKRTLLLVTMATANVFAVEKQELMSLIDEATAKQEAAYVKVRDKIVEYGISAIPSLGEIAVDETLQWQQQLVARICYERIERKKDIELILATDWYAHPKFNPDWNKYLTGPEWHMVDMIVADLKETGLWYYFLEQEWKATGEKAKIHREDRNPFLWRSCCTFAVKESLNERIWFLRICSEFMKTPDVSPRAEHLCNFLKREEKPDAAYVLEHRAPPSVTSEPHFRLGTNIIKRSKQPERRAEGKTSGCVE